MFFANKIVFSQAKKTVMLIVSWCLLVPLSHVIFIKMSYYYLNNNIELGSLLVLILFFVYIVFKMKWFDFKMQWALMWGLFSLLYLENIIMLYFFKNDALVDVAILYPMIGCGIFLIFHLSRKIYFNRAIRAFFSLRSISDCENTSMPISKSVRSFVLVCSFICCCCYVSWWITAIIHCSMYD